MTVDLQDVVDDLADQLGRPVTLEDSHWQLLVFSAHTSHEDRVRQASILARAAPADVVSWLHTLGLEQADALLDTPANHDIGMGPRTCAPVRHGGALLGFLWVIPGERSFDEQQRGAITAAADEAALTLWRRRISVNAVHEHSATLLSSLLDEADVTARERAAALLSTELDWSPDATFALAVAATGDHDAVELAERARRRWHAGDFVWRERDGLIAALGRLAPRDDAVALAGVLHAAGAPAAAAIAIATLADAHDGVERAVDALTVIQCVPALGPAAAHEQLGSWPTVARLWDALGRPSTPPPLGALLANDKALELARALESTLDAGGDVAAAADTQGVHRGTLYRRLRQVEDLCAIRLDDGDDRLRAHLALRMWRLAGSPSGGRVVRRSAG